MNKLASILREEGLLKKASQREYEDVIEHLLDLAESGRRLKYDGKTLWGGQGNTSGLHDYAEVERREKWERSGRRFEKKLRRLPPGAEVENFFYQSSTRSRGRWVPAGSFTIPDPNEAPKVDPNKVSMVNQDRDSNSFDIEFRGKTYRAGDTITLQDDFLWPGTGDGRPGDLILPKGSKVEITETSLGLDKGYSGLGPSIGLTPLGKAQRFGEWAPPGEADADDFAFTWQPSQFVPGGQPLRKIMTALGFGDPPGDGRTSWAGRGRWMSSDIPTGVFTLKKKYDWMPGSDPAFYSPRGSKVRITAGKRKGDPYGEMVFQPSKVLFKYEEDAPTAEEVRVRTLYTFKRDGFPLFSELLDGSRTPPEQEASIPEPYWAWARRRTASMDPVAGWVRKNKRTLETVKGLFEVSSDSPRGYGDPDWVISFAAVPQKYYWVSVKYDDTTDSYTGIDASVGVIRGGLDVGDVASSRKLLRLLNRLLKAALKAKSDRTVRVKRERLQDSYGDRVDPYGGYEVFVGPERIGKVWKGMDKKWHSSLYGAGYGYRFRSKQDAIDDLIEGGYAETAKSRGQRNPYWE